jgi:4-oxalocrotonate tautomerase
MPVVTVETWEGRTVEQKRALVAAITDAMETHFETKRENTHVIIHDIPKESWGRGGRLSIDIEPVEDVTA